MSSSRSPKAAISDAHTASFPMCAALTAVMDVATANNTVAIVIAAPIARNISEKYNVEPKETASLLDTCSCIMQGIIPYGAQLLIAAGIASIPSFSMIPFLIYPFVLAAFVALHISRQKGADEKEPDAKETEVEKVDKEDVQVKVIDSVKADEKDADIKEADVKKIDTKDAETEKMDMDKSDEVAFVEDNEADTVVNDDRAAQENKE